jgi:ribonuclease P protein component
MFPKEQRLKKSPEIIAVLRKGTRRNAPVVACSFLRRPGTVTRTAVIVGIKVSKRAVIRNLCKRRVRAILMASQLPQGDLIIQLRPGAQDLSFDQLLSQVSQCLRQLS